MKHLSQIQHEFLKEAAGNPAEADLKKDIAAEEKQQKAPDTPKAPPAPKVA
jgi:hypothetical protein